MIEKLIAYIVGAHKKAIENNENCKVKLGRKDWGKILDLSRNKSGVLRYYTEINKEKVSISVNKLGGGYGVLTITVGDKDIGLPLIYDGYINIIVGPRRDMGVLEKLGLEETSVECSQW